MMIGNLDLSNILWWLGAGLVGGLIVSAMIRTSAQGGFSATFFLSLVGGMLGGLLGMYFLQPNLTRLSLELGILAFLGGLILVSIQKTLLTETKYFKTKTS